jgi:hypothetical protein
MAHRTKLRCSCPRRRRVSLTSRRSKASRSEVAGRDGSGIVGNPEVMAGPGSLELPSRRLLVESGKPAFFCHSFSRARLRANSCARQIRGFSFPWLPEPMFLTTVYMTVAGARRFQGIRPQRLYIKDQPSWPIYVSNCIYKTYSFSGYLHQSAVNLTRS